MAKTATGCLSICDIPFLGKFGEKPPPLRMWYSRQEFGSKSTDSKYVQSSTDLEQSNQLGASEQSTPGPAAGFFLQRSPTLSEDGEERGHSVY